MSQDLIVCACAAAVGIGATAIILYARHRARRDRERYIDAELAQMLRQAQGDPDA